jgi:3-methyladenine DNA glycosylase/8-oxoguanine DNA glycosylase
MERRTVELDRPIDLRMTLRAVTPKAVGRRPALGCEWWMSRTPDGPASLLVEMAGEGVCGTAWGPGSGWVIARLDRLVGAHDDPTRFRPGPGIVDRLHRRHRGLRLGRTDRVFEALLPTILGQRVTSVEATRSYRAIVRRFGSPAPGPVDGWVPPAADDVAGLDYADLHALGVERSRASIIIEAARRSRRLEAIVDMEDDAADRRLRAVRGIGPWTSAYVRGAATGAVDAVPTGDYHLPDTVAWALAGEPRADDARMLELLAPYAGQRRRVLLLIGAEGIHAPKYGPKTAPRDIRSM